MLLKVSSKPYNFFLAAKGIQISVAKFPNVPKTSKNVHKMKILLGGGATVWQRTRAEIRKIRKAPGCPGN